MENSFFQKSRVDWQLVRGVSRSFYLTLRLLPRSIRSAITLAYLLARASDTIADISHQPVAIRLRALRFLQHFAQKGDVNDDSYLKDISTQLSNYSAEEKLLENLPKLMAELIISLDNKKIREVWGTILEGQIFDLEHPAFLPLQAEELDRYLFQVAGCVGQFWTHLCSDKIPQFASLPFQRMEALGISYGKGLQLINILRDHKEDALCGRVYIQEKEREQYHRIARSAMQSGIQYALALKSPFLRYATLLPALIGIRTLELIQQQQSKKAKISRKEVYQILFAAVPCLWKPELAASLSRCFLRE